MTTSKRQKRIGPSTKRKKAMLTIDYKNDFLMKDLQDLRRAAEYLTAAIEEGEDVFLLAVRDVAEAQGGLSALARATNLNRENLYDMLSLDGNPRLSSLSAVLSSLGLEVAIKPKPRKSKAA